MMLDTWISKGIQQITSKSDILDKSIIRDAELLVNHYVVFNNDWDMERCCTPYLVDVNKAYLSPNNDGEWVYQYTRMEYLHKLVIAFLITNNQKYINSYNQYVLSFFSTNTPNIPYSNTYPKNPLLKKAFSLSDIFKHRILGIPYKYPTYRTLDTAIRSYSLLIDSLYLKDIETVNISYIVSMVKRDVEYALNNLRDFDRTSNWGIIILSLSLSCRVIIGDKLDTIPALENQLNGLLRNQIKKDGGHIENSLMYNSQILLCLLRLIYWSNKNKIIIHPEILEYARIIAKYISIMSGPDGYQIQYGDSDKTNVSTLLFLSQKVLNCEDMVIHSMPNDLLLVMEFPDLLEDYFAFERPIFISTDKNHILNDGIWAYSDNMWDIRVFNEYSHSSHNHADNGEIILYCNNYPVLIDCGRFSYSDLPKRKFYRGPFAHNIVTMDNGLEWKSENANHFNTSPSNIKTQYVDHALVCEYEFNVPASKFSRCITVDKSGVSILSDIICQGEHIIQTIWNIPEFAEIQEQGNTLFISCSKYKLRIVHDGQSIGIRRGTCSYHYNEETDITTLIISSNIVNHGRLSVHFSSCECV